MPLVFQSWAKLTRSLPRPGKRCLHYYFKDHQSRVRLNRPAAEEECRHSYFSRTVIRYYVRRFHFFLAVAHVAVLGSPHPANEHFPRLEIHTDWHKSASTSLLRTR